MRSSFSSIMHKRIFTLNFDRSSEADPTIYKKLVSSIKMRGVVISTPTTIKSMMLKFLEWMTILNDVNSPRSSMMEADCQVQSEPKNDDIPLFADTICYTMCRN